MNTNTNIIICVNYIGVICSHDFKKGKHINCTNADNIGTCDPDLGKIDAISSSAADNCLSSSSLSSHSDSVK